MKNITVKIILCDEEGKELDITKDVRGCPFIVESIVLEENFPRPDRDPAQSDGSSKLMLATRTMNFRFSPKPKNIEEILKFIGASFV